MWPIAALRTSRVVCNVMVVVVYDFITTRVLRHGRMQSMQSSEKSGCDVFCCVMNSRLEQSFSSYIRSLLEHCGLSCGGTRPHGSGPVQEETQDQGAGLVLDLHRLYLEHAHCTTRSRTFCSVCMAHRYLILIGRWSPTPASRDGTASQPHV